MSEESKEKGNSSARAKQGEPYEWERCTIRLSISFFPDDGGEGGRPIVLGCNTHGDPPLIETVREVELGALPPAITGLLNRLKDRSPQQGEMAEAKRQAEIAAAEKGKLQRQIAEEKVKATPQKDGAGSATNPQPVAPTAQVAAASKSEASSPEESGGTSRPIGGNQQSLFS